MSSSIQFSGLASGLDTTSIISQLMSIESAPQTAIKNRVATQQAQVGALQTLNSSLAAISTAADSFRTGSTWTKLAATSSSASVSVTATSAAAQGSVSLTVGSVATAATLGFASAAALSDVITPPSSTLDVTLTDGSSVSVATGDGTLSSVIAALGGIQDASGNKLLTVSPVSVGGGQFRLLVSSASTGAGSLAVTPSGGGALLGGATSVAGTDASVSLGAGITVTSASNTFGSLLPGVSVTLGAGTPIGQPVQVTVADDGSARANGVNQFVKQLDELLSAITTQTAYGTNGKGGGALAGNRDLAGVVDALRMSIFPTDGTSLAAYGLDIDRYGTLTFDAAKFQAAYQADPAGVQAAFTGSGGWVKRVEAVADAASLPASGSVSQQIKALNASIAHENDDIAAWDDRLALKQASLEQIYTNLETQLTKLQAQQSWLSAQLDSLDSGWSQNQK
jgi:flagellar hook-associated protein 2